MAHKIKAFFVREFFSWNLLRGFVAKIGEQQKIFEE
jgi:hypothetical protein